MQGWCRVATPLWAFGLVVVATLIGAFGPILLKKGSANLGLSVRRQLKNYSLIGGVALYLVSSVFFIYALRAGDLSVLYPFVSVGYIWVCLLSVKFLQEKMSWLKWMGIFFIIVGVSLIGLAR